MRRRLRYQVAMSLDGFIAGPNGEYDWIVMDPAIDFRALYGEFDTAVMGRKTYEAAENADISTPGLDFIVFSRTLAPAARRGVRIVNDDPRSFVAALKKSKSERDLWLFGGGALFRSLLMPVSWTASKWRSCRCCSERAFRSCRRARRPSCWWTICAARERIVALSHAVPGRRVRLRGSPIKPTQKKQAVKKRKKR
jgi:hypothetical protein